MSVSGKFYLAQVAICERAAEETVLANQRDKYLRAKVAWQALADRENDIAEARVQREADRAAMGDAAPYIPPID